MAKRKEWIAVVLVVLALLAAAQAQTETQRVAEVVETFERALEQRDLPKIESVMDPALVVFENGHRNDGWADFRDNHLKPEMAEPAPAMKRELMKASASGNMAWAYSRATFISPRGRTYELWSVYVLEKKAAAWKVVMLDWSMRPIPAQTTSGAPAPGWTVGEAEEALRKAGLGVRRDVKVEQPYLKTPGTVLVIGEGKAEVQTYVYPSAEARKADSDTLDAKKAAPPTVSPHWLMPVSVITDGNLLAIVLTRDEGLRAKIAAALKR